MKGQQFFHSFWLSSTVMVLASQPALADVVQVRVVKLVNKANGLEVVLETPNSDSLELDQTNRISTSTQERTWIVDIANTQLSQPETENFPELLPAQGITAVRVQSHDRGIRVTVTGQDEVPTGEVKRTKEGIVLSLAAFRAPHKQPEQRNNPGVVQENPDRSEALKDGIWQKLQQPNTTQAVTPLVSAMASPQEANKPGEDGILEKLRPKKDKLTPTARQGENAVAKVRNTASRNTPQQPNKPTAGSEIRGMSTSRDTLLNKRQPFPNINTAQAPKQVAPARPNLAPRVQVPDYLNPDPNPLKFPTRPREVQV
ncbi:MAG: AMIN domain-containing protein, partial [Nostocaceae cyanobacterium]|nr:AMIN domain-containing protein [Nostocaceae cyanobacterium]